jgi:regulatory protein
MDLLARREHSRVELERKLSAKGFESATIAEVLEQLEVDGLLSHERFGQSFVAARYAKGQGPLRIRRELAERGVAVDNAWFEDDSFDWQALARQTRVRRFGAEPPADLKERARQTRFLEYRGFSHDQIRRALDAADE